MTSTTNSLLSYYYDAEATKPLPQDATTGNYEVDFGPEVRENPPIAGVRITEYPEFLEPEEIGLVRFAFAPSTDRIKPLEGGSWSFTMVVYSKV